MPVLSWLLLRGRCRQCRTWISPRYPLIELALGVLWTLCWLTFGRRMFYWGIGQNQIAPSFSHALVIFLGMAIFCWLLIALAALDAEHFWLPDWITIPGIVLGVVFTVLRMISGSDWGTTANPLLALALPVLNILFAAGVVIFIRLAYWLVRRQEGMGLGDAKLMAMLGAWLGLRGALESFALAIFGALTAALVWLAILAIRRKSSEWAKMPLPLGTFICLGALSEIFYPNWLWTAWAHAILNY